MDPASEAYWDYLRVRANFFNASFITSEDLAIVRLACLSRVHDRQAFICVQPDLAKSLQFPEYWILHYQKENRSPNKKELNLLMFFFRDFLLRCSLCVLSYT